MRLLPFLFALFCSAMPAIAAEDIVLGLSSDTVSIDTNFDGSEILIFGAVKRDAPTLAEPKLQVIVTVAGPSEATTIRRKEKKFGIWVNTDAVSIDHAPSFYAVSTSAPLGQSLSTFEDMRNSISIPRVIRDLSAPKAVQDSASFAQALVRIKESTDQYQLNEGTVSVDEQTLFRTSIALPSALTEGDYATRIFLTRGGAVVAQYETSIYVRKVGLERWLFTLSRENAFLYGLMSLAIAIAAGWGASALFGLIRR
ncbi:MAG: TIGR02186 family protein [Sulfitobacter sp.]